MPLSNGPYSVVNKSMPANILRTIVAGPDMEVNTFLQNSPARRGSALPGAIFISAAAGNRSRKGAPMIGGFTER